MQVYRVIYDAREAFDATAFLMMGLLVAIGLSLWGVGRADAWLLARAGAGAGPAGHEPGLAERGARMRRWGMLVLLTAPIMGSVGWMEWAERERLIRALESGTYTVVEGTVTDFTRGDHGRNREERFSVLSNGRRHTYAYASSRHQPGFHESHGPIREGLYVRIAEVDGYIARLETAW